MSKPKPMKLTPTNIMSTMNNPKQLEHFQSSWNITKLVTIFIFLIFMSYLFYTIGFLAYNNTSHQFDKNPNILSPIKYQIEPIPKLPLEQKTNISHIVFGIGASSKLWNHRKEYIKLWWKPNITRGNVWLDKEVKIKPSDEKLLPTLKISSDTSKFKYKHPLGIRSGIRISRIVSETVRLRLENVRWFVMGDDDTFFVTENLVKLLQKYDHNGFYYIGSNSESHFQNINFSYNMAYGGGGFAISYPLAVALERMQDRCIERYPKLYGSDDRIQACMAELGVPLTIEKGFHQHIKCSFDLAVISYDGFVRF
ncbi:putative O-fucosylpeptide 3-beta-N-acetylglucosaminyltransferase [Medicago truncatula]|uniref:Putative O-fucosylpeptide 3-beta-N-acetylglucosaminyltransferase n=1 Tax=Medicago truncatula TaxID=3880 RepID=A0A396H2R8_MEDTR|nr:putative O-fucosylpeptide 3-beta-N-acetylglucosaminyltransferase [Medicago truncatula]